MSDFEKLGAFYIGREYDPEADTLDGIPALVVDPKGDIANPMLTIPELTAAEFRPWIDAGEAARKDVPADELAAKTAETWQKGLAEWGQDGDRTRHLRDGADIPIYTRGSTAGTIACTAHSRPKRPARHRHSDAPAATALRPVPCRVQRSAAARGT